MRSLTVPAACAALTQVLAFLDEVMEQAGCPVRARMRVDVAAEEVFVNIASYAYAGGAGEAVVECAAGEGRITVRFKDRGMPYNPLAREDPDITRSAAERDVGGLGVYMVKKTMDEVTYAYTDGQNVLTLLKNY